MILWEHELNLTPAKLIEREASKLAISITHGGRPRGLGLEQQVQHGIPNVRGDVPYIVYQYDGGTYAVAFQGLRETERSIGYTLWHNSIHEAEALESKFYEALLKTGRIVGASQVFSFVDDSTGRTIGPGPGGPHGIQREVLIRR